MQEKSHKYSASIYICCDRLHKLSVKLQFVALKKPQKDIGTRENEDWCNSMHSINWFKSLGS